MFTVDHYKHFFDPSAAEDTTEPLATVQVASGTTTNATGHFTIGSSTTAAPIIGGNWGYSFSQPATPIQTNGTSGTIFLKGPDADIDINGVSLLKTLQDIQQRLGILKVNTELEAQWQELQDLGTQYRELENQILEKMKIWSRLSSK